MKKLPFILFALSCFFVACGTTPNDDQLSSSIGSRAFTQNESSADDVTSDSFDFEETDSSSRPIPILQPHFHPVLVTFSAVTDLRFQTSNCTAPYTQQAVNGIYRLCQKVSEVFPGQTYVEDVRMTHSYDPTPPNFVARGQSCTTGGCVKLFVLLKTFDWQTTPAQAIVNSGYCVSFNAKEPYCPYNLPQNPPNWSYRATEGHEALTMDGFVYHDLWVEATVPTP